MKIIFKINTNNKSAQDKLQRKSHSLAGEVKKVNSELELVKKEFEKAKMEVGEAKLQGKMEHRK